MKYFRIQTNAVISILTLLMMTVYVLSLFIPVTYAIFQTKVHLILQTQADQYLILQYLKLKPINDLKYYN